MTKKSKNSRAAGTGSLSQLRTEAGGAVIL